MKYYLFHLKEEYLDDVVGAEIVDSCLYAYTDNKEVYKRFKNERNLSMFRVRKIDASQEDINYLAKNHQNRILRIRKVSTSVNPVEQIETTICLTDDEYQNVQNEISFRMCNINDFKVNPLVFRNDILFSLCRLGIMTFASYILPFSDNPEWTERKKIFEDMSSKTTFEPDFLRFFILIYKNTLKEIV